MPRSLPDWCAPGGPRDYQTTRFVSHSVGRHGSDWVLLIEPGRPFESSVPRGLRWLVSPHDPRFLMSALVHDVLLEDGFRPFFAAGEWYAAAQRPDVPRATAFAMALGVLVVTVVKSWR